MDVQTDENSDHYRPCLWICLVVQYTYFTFHIGQYHCKGRIESSLGGEQISFVEEEHKLLLFVEITSIITMAVTGIIVTTVALIVIAGICCRYEKAEKNSQTSVEHPGSGTK